MTLSNLTDEELAALTAYVRAKIVGGELAVGKHPPKTTVGWASGGSA